MKRFFIIVGLGMVIALLVNVVVLLVGYFSGAITLP